MTLKELLGTEYKEGMTLEEVSTALAGITFPSDQSAEIEKLRGLVSKANSEAKTYKDKLSAKMSEEEKAASEQAELLATMKAELDAYKQKDAINENTRSLLSLGYDEALAEQTAKAMYEGDMKTVMANHKAFIDGVKANVKSEILADTPAPKGGADKPVATVTREQFDKMGFVEMMNFKNENPELYAEFTKGD